MIDSYEFGVIVINGKRYSSDVILYPDRVKDDWWRKEGHALCIDDLENVIEEKPDVIVVGIGNPGLMRVLPETEKHIKSQGIKLVIQSTKEACKTYNQLSCSQKVIALLHLTC
ncbi:MAG: MTH938/NDUFAF3 family protein [candidate division Zixibacteria bacterium]|nr:MTH938/NDUFAF3 family protein [candidate division Zixibacteria bacterium]